MENENYATVQPKAEQPVTVGDWVVTILITAIPLVNLVMLFVWGFGGNNTPASKANWAKATLIWMAIGIGIWLLFFVLFGSLFFMNR